ncbi:MAG: trypsin-like peptidase domain-containing protein [Bacillota bacterium]
MRRRLFLLATIAVLLLATPASASAPGISVIVNGQPIAAQAVVVNQSVYIPLRAVGESLGATVGWDGATNTATVTLEPPAPVVQVVEKRVEVPVAVPSFDAVAVYEKARTASYQVKMWNGEGQTLMSGFAVGSPTTILTAYHEDHPNLTVSVTDYAGRAYVGRLKATFLAYDAAIVILDTAPQGGTALEFADATPKVGEEVGLVSSPGTKAQIPLVLTVGRVALYTSGPHGLVADITQYEGSSGGVLLNTDGKAVGMQVYQYAEAPGLASFVQAATLKALLATVK